MLKKNRSSTHAHVSTVRLYLTRGNTSGVDSTSESSKRFNFLFFTSVAAPLCPVHLEAVILKAGVLGAPTETRWRHPDGVETSMPLEAADADCRRFFHNCSSSALLTRLERRGK